MRSHGGRPGELHKVCCTFRNESLTQRVSSYYIGASVCLFRFCFDGRGGSETWSLPAFFSLIVWLKSCTWLFALTPASHPPLGISTGQRLAELRPWNRVQLLIQALSEAQPNPRCWPPSLLHYTLWSEGNPGPSLACRRNIRIIVKRSPNIYDDFSWTASQVSSFLEGHS